MEQKKVRKKKGGIKMRRMENFQWGLHHHKTRNVVSHWTCIAFHEGVGPLLA